MKARVSYGQWLKKRRERQGADRKEQIRIGGIFGKLKRKIGLGPEKKEEKKKKKKKRKIKGLGLLTC
jgi:hypothetical protein